MARRDAKASRMLRDVSTRHPDAASEKKRIGSEDELIDWLRRLTVGRGGRWIGDDAAILPRSEQWAVTMDSQIEGVHFLAGLDPAILARRLLEVNLSDLAAMGALPAFAFLALSAPSDFDHHPFFAALVDACEQYDLELAGGDLSRQEKVVAVLTLLGNKPSGHRWLRRDAAKVGENLWLGGTIGEAATGLRLLRAGVSWEAESLSIPDHLELSSDLLAAAKRAVHRHLLPKAQIELGCWLGEHAPGAAIDVSDGLARDLDRLCSQSRVGAVIEIDLLPRAPHLEALIHALDGDWRQLALGGGEDYVLLFTLPAEIQPPRELGCTRIGTIVEGEIILVSEDGSKEPLSTNGWDHFSATEA